MADQFIEQQPLFYTKEKIWWLWNYVEKKWEMVDEIDVINKITEATPTIRAYESKTKAEIINALKMRGRLNTPKPAKPTWIQFKDMIYDLKTDRQFPATPEYHVTNPIPWALGDSEKTPELDKLFREWADPEFVQTLYEILAYCMLSDYPISRTFCLNGEGRNGKSSYMKILTTLIGEANTTSTDFDTLISSRFEAAKLYKKLVCLMGEINSKMFKKTALFRKLTGGDMISYEFKGKDGFDGYNYAKLIIASNKLPESTDKTIAFYSRWTIIDFTHTFDETPGLLERIPNKEYNNLALKSINILKNVLKRGHFTGDGRIDERMQKYEERASPIKDFLKKECYENPDQNTPFWELYKEYVAYLAQRGNRIATKREFSNLLKAKEFKNKSINYNKDDGTRGKFVTILGIGLQNRQLEDDEEREHKEEYGALKEEYD